jgi:hypothetical protein
MNASMTISVGLNIELADEFFGGSVGKPIPVAPHIPSVSGNTATPLSFTGRAAVQNQIAPVA